MICATCGTQNPPESASCSNCNALLVPEQEESTEISVSTAPAVEEMDVPLSEEAPTLPVIEPVQEQTAAERGEEQESVTTPPLDKSDAEPSSEDTAVIALADDEQPSEATAIIALADGEQASEDTAVIALASDDEQPSAAETEEYVEVAPVAAVALPSEQAQGSGGRMLALPLWIYIPCALVVAAALIFFTGADWAAGAQTAGVEALVVGTLFLLIFGGRALLGVLKKVHPYRRSQLISALLLVVLLFALSAFSLTQQSTIHAAQARVLESRQQWQPAINEFMASGQQAPASLDIARVYNEWGEQLTQQQQYKNAVARFSVVLTSYQQAGSEMARAENGATTAYYRLAEQQLAAQNYAGAVAAFTSLTTLFGNSSAAQQAHGDYARALLGEGKQQLTTACTSAVSTYTQLSRQFDDTPEGQQAKTALAQPQPVKGHFTSKIPGGDTVPFVALESGTSTFIPLSGQKSSGGLMQTVKKDGTFVFPTVKQGQYYLTWGARSKSTGNMSMSFLFLFGQDPYKAQVGPLCPIDLGAIKEAFPNPNNGVFSAWSTSTTIIGIATY